ncbi:MAG: class I SAM-dependent methyltransferase, partial [Methylacidiphilaceae bacterium]|nr:class I SAM-dependent methyltransferase [Candidatus Methylacidiphilaceae bacterium]
MRRVLRPGGRAFILEFSRPWAWIAPTYFSYLQRLLPEIARLFGAPREAYRYLASSIAAFPGPEDLAEEMERAGFGSVCFQRLTGGVVALHEAEAGSAGVPAAASHGTNEQERKISFPGGMGRTNFLLVEAVVASLS